VSHDRPANDPLIWPPEWRRRGKVSWVVGMLLLLGLVAGALGLGVVDIASGEVGRGGFFVLGAVFSSTALAAVYARRARRGRTAVERGELPAIDQGGVLIRYSRRLALGYLAIIVAGLVFFGVLAVGGVATVVDEGLGSAWVPLLLSVAVCGYLLWATVDIVLGRLARGMLALTPDGIYHRSWAMHAYVPWRDIMFVRATEAHGPLIEVAVAVNSTSWTRRTSLLWKQGELAFAPHLAVRADLLSVEPALAFHLVRF
jgi:hypothetical protein